MNLLAWLRLIIPVSDNENQIQIMFGTFSIDSNLITFNEQCFRESWTSLLQPLLHNFPGVLYSNEHYSVW